MRLRVGPLLLCTCVAAYRSVWLSLQLSGLDAGVVGYLLLADLPVVGALAILALVEASLPRAWKVLPLALTIVLVAFYLADVLAVLGLNSRLQLADLRQFAGEWWVVQSFVSLSSIATLLAAAACFFIRLPVAPRVARLVAVSAMVLLLLPLAVTESAPPHLQKYVGSVVLLGKELWGSRRLPVSRYSQADFAAYRAEYDALFDAPIARSGRNIILLVVESLSAADSSRTSGIRDALPRLDALSRQGMLFRNFFANFEASEGGIVALSSGVPPLHFPTASTNTFGEYALQRSITDSFRRYGYRCEFLTSVPLQFISMDDYTRSPFVGFSFAGGQRDIARYATAPRFAFESPADHVLYEELLARLDSRHDDNQQPVLMTVVTASSHPPYVDPLGRADTAENVWAYVQEEIWWLYGELTRRGFFENGLLLITGDHRKMLPISQAERERYGDSAKARVPLVIIGAGVPKGVLDDRLFQQSDLLRMLDRAVRPAADLSPFVVWVERYVYVLGVASNASNLEVFEGGDPRVGFRLKLRGTEIEWLSRPPNALGVELAVHRQRALQQSLRAARTTPTSLDFGRDLTPSDRGASMLVGVSADVDLGRNPDEPRGDLKMLTTDSFDLNKVLPLVGGRTGPFTLTARAFLPIPKDGEYWFSAYADDESCLAIDKEVVLGCYLGLNEGVALLTAGLHRFDLRFVERGGGYALQLKWLTPDARTFVDFPQQTLILPESRH